ncbi:MAG: RluA family pseudouridine synthase [Armatimonadota bacterium]|nr:RluA family pseudouridine synthase [Armatimonadota bacterium]
MPELIVSPEDAGLRLDVFLALHEPSITRSAFERLISEGRVTLNGLPTRPARKVRAGDVVAYSLPPPKPAKIKAEEIPIDIIYEDSDIIVVNKPKGMVTHPAPGREEGTLVNALLAHCKGLSQIGGVERPGIVHRLDKDTSGLMVVAKNDMAYHSLQKQIQARTAIRKYLALVWGDPKFENAVVDAPIGRHPVDRKKMAVIESLTLRSRIAITDFHVLERFGLFALVEASLRTGRTHQVRVHSAYIGHPVVGDPVYSGKRRVQSGSKEFISCVNRMIDGLQGQALHAHYLSFDHPKTNKRLEFTSEMPVAMQSLIEYLRKNISTIKERE